MDIGAGFFARLKFATDTDISVDFAKDSATLAHQVAQMAQNSCEEDGTVINNEIRISRIPDVPVTELSDCITQHIDLSSSHNLPDVSTHPTTNQARNGTRELELWILN